MTGSKKYILIFLTVISIILLALVIIKILNNKIIPSSSYNLSDNIAILNGKNFATEVLNQEKVFFVLFFSSWCGACINYAKTYKQLAKDMRQWQRIVQLGAVDCDDQLNSGLCREYNIQTVPTMMYIKYKSAGPNDSVKYMGYKYNISEMALDIAQFVYNDWKHHRPAKWPNFETSNNSTKLEDVLFMMPSNAKLLALIAENSPSRLAWAQMIAFANDERIYVAQIECDNPIVQHINFTVPSGKSQLFLLKRSQSIPLYISKNSDTWLQIQNKINKQLAEIFISEIPGLQQNELNEKTSSIQTVEVTWSQFEVQMMDIITALRHMLMFEIPRKSVINEEHLGALKLWMRAMKKYMPGTIEIRILLYRLNYWIENISAEITYKQWTEKVEILQEQLGQPVPSTANYMACRGSKNYFRGFPCGLWTIIHAMSIQAYELEKRNANFSSNNDLIQSFHQFIWHFFICAECAAHFHEEILRQNMSAVVTPEDGIMWLWRTHNIINKFVARTASEDPAFPKQQFPPISLCSRCWKQDGQFDQEAVLDFMINYYGNLKVDGLGVSSI